MKRFSFRPQILLQVRKSTDSFEILAKHNCQGITYGINAYFWNY